MKNFQLKKIIAKSKKYIYGDLLGEHNSKQIGDGYDFAKIRPYVHGENIKRVDPFASAKTGEIYLRSFYESREINVEVVTLMSGSLYFGSQSLKQYEVAQIVSHIGFDCIKNSDRFTLTLFSDRVLKKLKPTKKETGVVYGVEQVLNQKILHEQVDYDRLKDYALRKIQKRSYLFIIGDFFEIPKLKALSKKHEVVVVKVRDKFEQNPSAIGELGVIDPSNNQKFDISFNSLSIQKYKKDLKKHDLKLGEYLKNNGIRLIEWIN